MNLYKLRHMKEKDDMYWDQIRTENGSLKIWKTTGDYKNYGINSCLLPEVFLNYSAILFNFSGTTSPALYLALTNFNREIIDLTRMYEWQGGLLPLAINLHTQIVESHLTDLTMWEIPAKWQGRFCNPSRLQEEVRRLPYCPWKLEEKP